MREITSHQCGHGHNEDLQVTELEQNGLLYVIRRLGGETVCTIDFAALTVESLLAACMERLESQQRRSRGDVSRELALTHVQSAMSWLHQRERELCVPSSKL